MEGVGHWSKIGSFLAKRNAGGCLQELMPSHAGGTTSGSCPSGASPPPCAFAIGAASWPSGLARPFISEQLERKHMSLIDQAPEIPSNPNKPRGSADSYCRPSTALQQPTRMVRITVRLPRDLVDRLRDVVYWSPSLTLAWLIAQSLRTSLTEMESLRRGPFPKRTKALRAGRPRLAGQTMSVSPRVGLIDNGIVHPAERMTQAIHASQPPTERC